MSTVLLRRLASMVGAIGLAVFASGSANAALVSSFQLNNVGDNVAYQRVVPSPGSFTDDFTLTLTADFSITVSVADTTTNPGGSRGINNLDVEILGVAGPIGPLPAIITTSLLAANSPFTIRVTGERKGNAGVYTLYVNTLSREVGEVPIPGAALLFFSGLGALGMFGRKRKAA